MGQERARPSHVLVCRARHAIGHAVTRAAMKRVHTPSSTTAASKMRSSSRPAALRCRAAVAAAPTASRSPASRNASCMRRQPPRDADGSAPRARTGDEGNEDTHRDAEREESTRTGNEGNEDTHREAEREESAVQLVAGVRGGHEPVQASRRHAPAAGVGDELPRPCCAHGARCRCRAGDCGRRRCRCCCRCGRRHRRAHRARPDPVGVGVVAVLRGDEGEGSVRTRARGGG